MTLYERLGVPATATAQEIKKAYRRRVAAAHPDQGTDGTQFRAICQANDVLSDPDKRKVYDETGLVTGEDKLAESAIQVIGMLAQQALVENPNCNLKAVITAGLDKERIAAQGMIDRMRKAEASIAKRWGGAETLKRVIQINISGVIMQAEGRLKTIRRADEMMREATYQQPEQQSVRWADGNDTWDKILNRGYR